MVALIGSLPGMASTAEAADAATAKRNVNLSAMQGMLLEQMTKSACLVALGEHTEANIRYLDGALGQFGKVQKGLRAGDAALGLAAETDPRVLQGLDRMDQTISRVGPLLTAMANSGVVTRAALDRLTFFGTPALEAAQDVAQRSERQYGATDGVPSTVTLKISLAARQRLLSQAMSKQFCLVALDMEAEKNRAVLAETVSAFENTLNALIDGFEMFGLAAETDPERRAVLEYVRVLWSEVAPAYKAVIDGASPDAASIRAVAWQDKVILARMNAVVFMYELDAAG